MRFHEPSLSQGLWSSSLPTPVHLVWEAVVLEPTGPGMDTLTCQECQDTKHCRLLQAVSVQPALILAFRLMHYLRASGQPPEISVDLHGRNPKIWSYSPPPSALWSWCPCTAQTLNLFMLSVLAVEFLSGSSFTGHSQPVVGTKLCYF